MGFRLRLGGTGGGASSPLPGVPSIAVAGSDTQNTIFFTDSGPAALSHDIWRSTVSGSEVFITNTASSPYADTGLTNGTQYFYKAKAVNAAGSSALSTEASATPTAVLYNFAAAQFTKWKAAAARVRSASGRGKVVCIGDSTMNGSGGGDSGAHDNKYANNWPNKTAQGLSGLGLTAICEGIIGFGNLLIGQINGPPPAKAGFTAPSAWAVTSTTMGGQYMQNASNATPAVYTPQINVDSFELIDLTASTAGSLNYNIDGGSDTTLVQTGSDSSRKTVINAGSVGSHTLNMTRVSGTAIVCGARAWDSTMPAVDFYNMGWGGSTAASWISNTRNFFPLATTTTQCADADLVMIDLTINNCVANTAEATYKANMQTIIDLAKAGGASVLLVTGNPINPTSASQAQQDIFKQYYKDLAVTNSLPMVDQYALYTDYATLSGLGYMFDSLHPNKAGYANFATYMTGVLNNWAR